MSGDQSAIEKNLGEVFTSLDPADVHRAVVDSRGDADKAAAMLIDAATRAEPDDESRIAHELEIMRRVEVQIARRIDETRRELHHLHGDEAKVSRSSSVESGLGEAEAGHEVEEAEATIEKLTSELEDRNNEIARLASLLKERGAVGLTDVLEAKLVELKAFLSSTRARGAAALSGAYARSQELVAEAVDGGERAVKEARGSLERQRVAVSERVAQVLQEVRARIDSLVGEMRGGSAGSTAPT
eukprot:m51a1_g10281 hypothetical protein (243) ;mRNA; r:81525-82546